MTTINPGTVAAATQKLQLGSDDKIKYQDKTSGKEIKKLKTKQSKGEISGDDMQKAIVDGTSDKDNQAAGKEHADFKQYTDGNWDNLSPNAKEKFRVYDKHAKKAQANGQTGIKNADYKEMVREMKTAGYKDQTSGRAIETLKDKTGTISGDDMQKAIVDGTKDRDNSAAGNEYKDFAKFTKDNASRLSPEAKAKYGVYDKYAKQAQANGQTGIKDADYKKMVGEMKLAGYQDKGAGQAIEDLKAKNPNGTITGKQMQDTIVGATKDLDNQAAGKEYNDLKKFSDQNWDRMSPNAREKFRTYEGYAKKAQAKGETGIKTADYDKMKADLNKAGYKDAGAGKAIETLKDTKGEISGPAMEKAIVDATKDLDNSAAGTEYKDLKKFSTENWDRMSPNAREKFRTYEKYAKSAQAKGETGIRTADYDKMKAEMKTAGYNDPSAGKAIETLKDKPGTISGDDMQKAIIDGTKDLDNQAAGKEYKDFQKFATDNWGRMSPQARNQYRTYEKYARSAKAQGKTGIDKADFNKMVGEMRGANYQDKTAGAEIEKLKNKTGEISGTDMQNAIINGTKDFDNQAAGAEYNDFKKFATDNWDRMSPDAKAKFRVYEDSVKDARERGLTGIPNDEYKGMVGEMKRAGYKDASTGQALERLESQRGPITSDDMQRAIIDGTRDLDNNAAAGEFRDISKFAAENWDRMTPGARAKFRTYEQYAQSAQARGLSGIPNDEWNHMTAQMKTSGYLDASAGREIDKLWAHHGMIDSRQLIGAIDRGTADWDGQAAGREFADFYRFAHQNWNRLTPDAQAAFGAYAQHAQNSWLNGNSGIQNWGNVMGDMRSSADLLIMRTGYFRI